MEYVDVVVLGTGLTESITAAALSKAGFKVAHIDVNPYYGANEASLSVDELVQWAAERTSDDPGSAYLQSQKATFPHISISPTTLSQSRQYAISLAPSIIPSVGSLISSLISSGVARYGGYRLLERVGIYESGIVKDVPSGKEDIFKNKDISLIDKRRLMRFLAFAAGEFEDSKELADKADVPFVEFLKGTFSLKESLASVIAYALAFCVVHSEPTLPALCRIRNYLRASGRYGPSPFLIGHYGGAGEIAQGFCRVAAVAGAIYILGKRVTSVRALAPPSSLDTSPSETPSMTYKYTVELEDIPDKLACNVVISSADLLPPELRSSATTTTEVSMNAVNDAKVVLRCIAIIDTPIYFPSPAEASRDQSGGGDSLPTGDNLRSKIDTAIIVFPPSSLPGGSTESSVHVMITGEGSMSTPNGKWIVYISIPCLAETSGVPEHLLQPYLDAVLLLRDSATLASQSSPLFTVFYSQVLLAADLSHPKCDIADPGVITSPPAHPFLVELSDSSAAQAEPLFWKAIHALKLCHHPQAGSVEKFWPLKMQQGDEDQEGDW